MTEQINDKIFTTFDDIFSDNNLLTDEEREQINSEAASIGKLIEVRESKSITQEPF